jgi:hypothetical protein
MLATSIRVVECGFGSNLGEVGYSPFRGEGDLGSAPGRFFVDDSGFIYIWDGVNERVQIFDPSGKAVKEIKEEWNVGPTAKRIFREQCRKQWNKPVWVNTFVRGDSLILRWRRKKKISEDKFTYETLRKIIYIIPYSKEEILRYEKNPLYKRGTVAGCLGYDGEGNFYVWYPFTHMMCPLVSKFDSLGNLIGTIRIKEIADVDVGYGRYVAPNGDLYIPNVDGKKGKWWIDKYPAELWERE